MADDTLRRGGLTAGTRLFLRDRRANIAVMTALTLPVLVLTTMGGVSVTMGLAKRQELRDIAQLACNRAVKPTRMKIREDADRTMRARDYFDQMAADRGITIVSRDVTTGWLTGRVTAKASIPIIENVAIKGTAFTVSADVTCEGIPPFPKKNDTILTSNFEKPDGSALPFKNVTWGVYKATEFGWKGGDGPGVEIQDWANPKTYGALPPGSKSRYVVELDSHGGPNGTGNSSMYRDIELHKGTYRFSFWYFGRQDDALTNTISVYLTGERPVGPKVQKLTVSQPRSAGWVYSSFEIPVETYSIYRLTIAAEGTDDTKGGNFNDLKLEYIKRPGDV